MLKLFLLSSLLVLSASETLPPALKACPRASPDLAQCVKDVLLAVQPYLATGDLGNGYKIEPLEPGKMGNISVDKGVQIDIYNMLTTGLSHYTIEKIRIDIESFKLEVLATVPRMNSSSKYKMKLKLGPIQLKGNGKASAVIENIKIKLKAIGTKYQKDGVDYIKIDKVDISLKPGKLTMNFENLFNGDKALSDFGNQLINENAQLFIDDVAPPIQDNLAKRVLESFNIVFSKAPFATYFP